MSLPPRDGRENAHTCYRKETGVGVGSSRAGRMRRHAIEWDWEEGWDTRADQSISKESTTLPFHKDIQRVRHRTPAVQSPPLRPSIFPLSSRCRFPPRGTSSPFAPYLALSPRIRSSPSISRPLLFLLSICALSGRFEARWKLRDKSWNVRTHTYVPERAHMNATRAHVRV